MGRRLRIAVVCALTLAAVGAVALWIIVGAARRVQPFYQQAVTLDRDTLERGRQELESRATTLYSDVRSAGAWQALFTAEQINGWLAGTLASQSTPQSDVAAENIREPRVAISPGVLTLGFTTTRSGVETVISVDAVMFLTDERDIAVRLDRVRAGSLPLPAAMVADEIAAACRRLPYPVLWMDQDGAPTAVIKFGHGPNADAPRFTIDAIELTEGELFVAGHTDFADANHRLFGGDASRRASKLSQQRSADPAPEIDLSNYEAGLSQPASASTVEAAAQTSIKTIGPTTGDGR